MKSLTPFHAKHLKYKHMETISVLYICILASYLLSLAEMVNVPMWGDVGRVAVLLPGMCTLIYEYGRRFLEAPIDGFWDGDV